MTTIVTGGAGFIGSHLVDRLLADGGEVIVGRQLRPVLPARRQGGEPGRRAGQSAVPAGRARHPRRRGRGGPGRLGAARRDRPPGGAGGRAAEHRRPAALRRRQRAGHRQLARGRLPARAPAAVRLRVELQRLRRPRRPAVPRDRPGRPARQPVCGDQAGLRADGAHLPPPARAAGHGPAVLHGLRTAEPARPGHRQVRPADRPRRAGADVRRRHDPARLHLRRRHRRRHRPGDRALLGVGHLQPRPLRPDRAARDDRHASPRPSASRRGSRPCPNSPATSARPSPTSPWPPTSWVTPPRPVPRGDPALRRLVSV